MSKPSRKEIAQMVERKQVRLVVIPGWVRSQHDSEYHYISARELANLYGVPLDKCFVLTEDAEIGFRRQDNDIYLTPKEDGDYTLSI